MEIKICNFCEKTFDTNDYINGGTIYDNLSDSACIDMCSKCYHKIMSVLSHHCKIEPFEDKDEDEDEDFDDEEGME